MSDVINDMPEEDTSLLSRLNNPTPRPPVRQPQTEEPTTSSAKALSKDDDVSLTEWFRGFSGSQIKVTLVRNAPEVWEGHQVAGVLDHFDELIDEESIKERFGGGKYQIKAQKMMPNGRWQFAGARTIKIAGDPKLTGELFKRKEKEDPVIIPNPEGGLAQAALAMTQQIASAQAERADRLEQELRNNVNKGFDPTMLTIVVEPFKMQIQTLTMQISEKDRQLAEKDKIIHELSNKKPDTTLQDSLIGKMYDGESSKIQALRVQTDSERRMLIESHRDEIKRIEARFDLDKAHLIEAHKRELKSLEQAYEGQIKAKDIAFQGLLDAKDNRGKDLERQLTRAETELGELRAKKDKSLIEQMNDLAHIKQTMGEFFGEDKEEEESTATKIIGAIAENPIVKGIGERLASGQPVQAPPISQPAPQVRRVHKPRPVGPQGTGSQPVQKPALPAPPASIPGVSQADVVSAVQFMESALAAGTPPETFTQSVRGMLPAQIIETIKTRGVDFILDEIAKVPDESPLSTVVGRKYARTIGKLLTET